MPRGIPHSVFLGRIVGPEDAEWEAEDVRLALGWEAWRASFCDGCGQPKRLGIETVDDDDFDVHVHVCAGCTAKHRRLSKLAEDGVTVGLYAAVEHNPRQLLTERSAHD